MLAVMGKHDPAILGSCSGRVILWLDTNIHDSRPILAILALHNERLTLGKLTW